MSEVIEFGGRRFVWSRAGNVFEYAGRTDAAEDSAGIIGWEFGRDELREMEAVVEAGGHAFDDGPIGNEIDKLVAAMNSAGAAMIAHRDNGGTSEDG